MPLRNKPTLKKIALTGAILVLILSVSSCGPIDFFTQFFNKDKTPVIEEEHAVAETEEETGEKLVEDQIEPLAEEKPIPEATTPVPSIPSNQKRIARPKTARTTPETAPSELNPLIKDYLEKYSALEQYSAEYAIHIDSEEPDPFSPYGDGTQTGTSLSQKIDQNNDDYQIHIESPRNTILMFETHPVRSLDEYFVDDILYNCGNNLCQISPALSKSWDWDFYKNPNLFYEFLKTPSLYKIEHLGALDYHLAESETDGTYDKFLIEPKDPIQLKNIAFIDADQSRKVQVIANLDQETSLIIGLSILTESDSEKATSTEFSELIGWHMQALNPIADEIEINLPGQYRLLKNKFDENNILFIIQPYISFTSPIEVKIHNYEETEILKEITLESQTFPIGQYKKIEIEHNLDIEENFKYELCLNQECKTFHGRTIEKTTLECLRNSLNQSACEKNSACFYDNPICIDASDCSSILLKDQATCEKYNCHWTEDGTYSNCGPHKCRHHEEEESCNLDHKCEWLGWTCGDVHCYAQYNQAECEKHDFCEWKTPEDPESKSSGKCEDIST